MPIADVLLRLVARISARVFVGLPLCRNEKYLKVSIDDTMNIAFTSMSLRLMPSFLHFLHPIIVHILPFKYWIYSNRRTAQKFLHPILEEHIKARESGTSAKGKESTLMTYMSDIAVSAAERDLEKLARRQLLLGIASIHTVKTVLTHIFYDLCAHPEYIAELREEVEEIMLDGGRWDKPTLSKMRKVESFMTESLRMNPPQLRKLYPPPLSRYHHRAYTL